MSKIWANSGDSHLVEPEDLFTQSLPAGLAERIPRSVKDTDGKGETLHIGCREFRRRMAGVGLHDEDGRTVEEREPGTNEPRRRLIDIKHEAI